jgi:hypothetical protein
VLTFYFSPSITAHSRCIFNAFVSPTDCISMEKKIGRQWSLAGFGDGELCIKFDVLWNEREYGAPLAALEWGG